MTKPKPKTLGTVLTVEPGTRVIRPGASEGDALTIKGGAYVLDMLGEHHVGDTVHTVVAAEDASA